jgi:hypothetical protein
VAFVVFIGWVTLAGVWPFATDFLHSATEVGFAGFVAECAEGTKARLIPMMAVIATFFNMLSIPIR